MCTLITQHTSTKLALVVLKHDCCTQLICEGLHLLITPRRTHTGTGTVPRVVDIPYLRSRAPRAPIIPPIFPHAQHYSISATPPE